MADRDPSQLLLEGLRQRTVAIEAAEKLIPNVLRAASTIRHSLSAAKKALIFGNGGSAADAQHFAAELVGRFRIDRRPLAAIALTTDTSALTAIGNDFGFEEVFSRQVDALGTPGDVVMALTTSGRSPNVIRAAEHAVRGGLHVIAMTGAGGGLLRTLPLELIEVPSADTAVIQELHGTLLHLVCEVIDAELEFPGRLTMPNGDDCAKVGIEDLGRLRDVWRKVGLRIVSTNGCFDVLHRGHIDSLHAARALGDVLVVGLNSDASVRRLKGEPRPMFRFDDRCAMISALRAVSAVVEIDDDPSNFLTVLQPDIHCKGDEYRHVPYADFPERRVVEAIGGRIEFLPLTPGFSTTTLVGRWSQRP